MSSTRRSLEDLDAIIARVLDDNASIHEQRLATAAIGDIVPRINNLGVEGFKKATKAILKVMDRHPSTIDMQIACALSMGRVVDLATGDFGEASAEQSEQSSTQPSERTIRAFVEFAWQESLFKAVMRALSVLSVPHPEQLVSSFTRAAQVACYRAALSMLRPRSGIEFPPEETLRAIPTSMDSHVQDAELTRQAFNLIACAAHANTANMGYLEKDSVPAMMRAMWAHEADAEILNEGCQTLYFMCWNSHPVKMLLLESGAPQYVLGIMKKFETDCKLVCNACRYLYGMVKDNTGGGAIADALIEMHVLEAVVHILKIHADNVLVQEAGVIFGAELYQTQHAEIVKKGGEQGLPQLALDIIPRFKDSSSIQRSGCAILSLSLGAVEVVCDLRNPVERLKDSGNPVLNKFLCACIPVILMIMSSHMRDKNVLVHAISALYKSSFAPESGLLIHEHHGLSIMTKVMDICTENTDRDVSVHAYLLMAITNLMKHSKELQDTCRKTGLIDVILRVSSRRQSEEKKIISRVHCALMAVTNEHDGNTEYLKQRMSRRLAAMIYESRFENGLRKTIMHNHGDVIPEEDRQQMQAFLKDVSPHRDRQDVIAQVAEPWLKEKSGQICVLCSKSAADVGLLQLSKCSACTLAPLYCGPGCQKMHWKVHKAECKANRKA
jgi:hypothetical protein